MNPPSRDKHGWPTSCVVCRGATIAESDADSALYRCGGEANKWGWIAGDSRCDELKAITGGKDLGPRHYWTDAARLLNTESIGGGQ